jgi:undecaprenyl diphosphate synthase
MGLIEEYQIEVKKLPQHVAIIMDGNGRWAKKQGVMRIFGHQSAVKAVRETVEAAAEIGIPYLTLYAFSTENWQRPAEEVNALMELLVSTLKKELKTMNDNNIRLSAIGNIQDLPPNCQNELEYVIQKTRNNTRMNLILALSYGSRQDILNAIQKIVYAYIQNPSEKLTEQKFKSFLSTHDIPDPDLLIRTSGEYRISNFLLWEIAYTELYFTNTLWPDFRKKDFMLAIQDYQKRERRFGKISEQIQNNENYA